MKKNVLVILSIFTIFSLSACGDSTNMTSIGVEYKEIPKDIRNSWVEGRKNVKREDYYGKWYFFEKVGNDTVEITIIINKKFIKDVYSGVEVPYKYNNKTNEIIVELRGLKKFLNDDKIISGNLSLTYVNNNDGESINGIANPTKSGDDKPTPLFMNYKRIDKVTKEEKTSTLSEDNETEIDTEQTMDERIDSFIETYTAIPPTWKLVNEDKGITINTDTDISTDAQSLSDLLANLTGISNAVTEQVGKDIPLRLLENGKKDYSVVFKNGQVTDYNEVFKTAIE
ncbi:TPA: hypothetical protein I0H53_RS12860 [Enterococcus faecalis]|nr:hypothetical protein [Enterococcus faecalis]